MSSLATIAALRANTTISTPVFVCGYATDRDGGEGIFLYVASDITSADNGGTIIVDASSRRWYRMTAGLRPSAKWFGAKGDGSTDDTTAFSNALAAIASGPIGAPAATYVLSSTLTIGSAQYLVGDGPNATIYQTSSATVDVFVFSSGTSGGAGMSGFTIQSSVTRTAGRYIYDPSGYQTDIENFAMFGAFIGIEMNGVISFVRNGSIRNCVAGTGCAIKLSGGNDRYIDNIVCDNPSGQPLYGLWVTQSGGGDVIAGCDFVRCGTGIYIAPGSGQTVEWMFFTDSMGDTCNNYPIGIAPSGSGNVFGCAFENCWASSGSKDGMLIDGAGTGWIDGISITGLRALNNQYNGVNIGGQAKNIDIIGGLYAGNSQASAGTYWGVAIGNSVVGVTVDGVKISATAGLADSQGGIFIGTSTQFISITGNDLNTAHTPLSYSSLGSGTFIRNNRGFTNEAHGESVISSGSSVAVTHGLSTTPVVGDIMISPVSNWPVCGINAFWVSAAGATTFTVSTNASVTAPFYFNWRATIAGAP